MVQQADPAGDDAQAAPPRRRIVALDAQSGVVPMSAYGHLLQRATALQRGQELRVSEPVIHEIFPRTVRTKTFARGPIVAREVDESATVRFEDVFPVEREFYEVSTHDLAVEFAEEHGLHVVREYRSAEYIFQRHKERL